MIPPGATALDLLIRYVAKDGERYLLRLRCDGYDEQAPSFQFVNPVNTDETGNRWWPRFSQQSIARLDDGTAVFCAYGIREYHLHTSHRGEARDKTKWTLSKLMTLTWEFFNRAGEYQGRGI